MILFSANIFALLSPEAYRVWIRIVEGGHVNLRSTSKSVGVKYSTAPNNSAGKPISKERHVSARTMQLQFKVFWKPSNNLISNMSVFT